MQIITFFIALSQSALCNACVRGFYLLDNSSTLFYNNRTWKSATLQFLCAIFGLTKDTNELAWRDYSIRMNEHENWLNLRPHNHLCLCVNWTNNIAVLTLYTVCCTFYGYNRLLFSLLMIYYKKHKRIRQRRAFNHHFWEIETMKCLAYFAWKVMLLVLALIPDYWDLIDFTWFKFGKYQSHEV